MTKLLQYPEVVLDLEYDNGEECYEMTVPSAVPPPKVRGEVSLKSGRVFAHGNDTNMLHAGIITVVGGNN